MERTDTRANEKHRKVEKKSKEKREEEQRRENGMMKRNSKLRKVKINAPGTRYHQNTTDYLLANTLIPPINRLVTHANQ